MSARPSQLKTKSAMVNLLDVLRSVFEVNADDWKTAIRQAPTWLSLILGMNSALGVESWHACWFWLAGSEVLPS